jgi:signal transduction histidine kinase
MVQGSARHLLALINDVLDISKIEAGQLEVSQREFDLIRSAEKVANMVRPLAAKKNLELRLEYLMPRLPLLSDERRVEQILMNLLSNAIKFTDTGSVTVAIDLPEKASMVRIRVIDTGIGIQAADLQNLFVPFRQVDSGLTRKHEGTGLGLAICRRLTDLLNGLISVESEFGRGSTFCVTLPLPGAKP